MAADLIELAATRPVELVIREPWKFGGALAAAHLGIPCVLHGIGAIANVEEVVELAGPRLCQHAAEYGQPDDLWAWIGGDLYLDPCPPCLQNAATLFHPKTSQPLRPDVFDTTDGDASVPEWMDDLGARPVVYVGLGTVINRWHGLLERLVGEIRELDVDVVVTTGPGFDPADLGQQPGNVRDEQYLPLSTLLPRCDLVVCHAGWGTTIAALTHALPIIAIPLGADGHRTAQQLHDSGLGRCIAHETVGSGAIATAVTDLLHNDTARIAARSARLQIQTMSGPPEAAHVINGLVRTAGPLIQAPT